MDESERMELARFRQHQARLEAELRQLSEQFRSFEQRLSRPAATAGSLTTSPTPGGQAAAPPLPLTQQSKPNPPPIMQPGAARAVSAQPQATARQSSSTVSAPAAATPPKMPEAIPMPALPRTAATRGVEERSFEMRLGTFWLVRIGIVMVLTGLVFFGNLAYQNYISKLGPGGKVSMLYLASSGLLAAGWWWQRKAMKDALRNYAQVLFAGGLAALYFTTYAAHHLEPLRIIQSPLFDGVLLLGCAGLMIWAAERKRSEVLALFAVGLAYYTSIITRVGHFTLWSNLVLCSASVLFLIRNRWATLSFGSLVATYAAYGFWRFFNGTDWHWASPEDGLWSGTWFLMSYWAVFTSAVFLSKDEKFAGPNRASFLTCNNAAFFGMFLLTMLQVSQGGFWKFSLVYGAVLLVLALLAKRQLPREPLAANAYLTQGLLLVTVGFISKFAGMQLALILGTESVLLLMMGQQRRNLVLLTGGYISAALAIAWGMDGLKPFDSPSLWEAIGLGILMMANTFLVDRQLNAGPVTNSGPLLRPQPSYFTVLAFVICSLGIWHNTSNEIFPLVLAAEALALTLSIYLLRIREVAWLAQGIMALAIGAWFASWFSRAHTLPWWNPGLLIAITLIMSHWWPRQDRLGQSGQTRQLWPAVYSLALNLVLYLWLTPKETGPSWIVITSAMAIGVTVYGVTTRAWFVAAFGQLFVTVAVIQFAWQLWQGSPPWRFTLAPIAALGLLSFGTVQWFKRSAQANAAREPLLEAALVYRWVAVAMSIAWICDYIPARERIWVLSLIGLALFLWSGRIVKPEALVCSAVFTATAVSLFWVPLLETPVVYLPDLIAIILLLAQRQVARRFPQRYPLDPGIHNAVILVGGLSLWLFVSRWVLELANGFYLTASWSVLALILFTTGLSLRERMYRWIGLGVLACALGRVVLFDVWKLETVYRILSFMALGIVLLVLGFIYSKYQEKIKEWL
jgi:uncharacterized membrane protein